MKGTLLSLPGFCSFPVNRRTTMPGRAAKITITERQQEILRKLGNSVTAPSRLRQRAKIILLAFEGTDNQDVARDIGLERHQVGRWRLRWAAAFNRLVLLSVPSPPRPCAGPLRRSLPTISDLAPPASLPLSRSSRSSPSPANRPRSPDARSRTGPSSSFLMR